MTVFDTHGSFAKLLPGESNVQKVHESPDEIDDADLYGRHRSRPEIKARADAEWEASDWRGRLPEGWTYKGETR